MIKKVKRQEFSYIKCYISDDDIYYFYIDIEKFRNWIDDFMILYENIHNKYGAVKYDFKNLDDAEKCLKELMSNEEFESRFIMEKLLGE